MSFGEALPLFEGEDDGQLNTHTSQLVVSLVPTKPMMFMPDQLVDDFECVWSLLEELGFNVVADMLCEGADGDSELVFLIGPDRHLERVTEFELLERIAPDTPVWWCPKLHPEQFVLAAVFHSFVGPYGYFSFN